MTTLTGPVPISRQTIAPWSHHAFVVASDGREPSNAALLAAKRLAPGGAFDVLTVAPADDESDDQPERIDAQVHRLFGEYAPCQVEARRGYPPAVISSYASMYRASMLIVGLGRPRVHDRLLGDESTLRIARMTTVTLLAVAEQCAMPPRRIVIATDFSETSIAAARLSLELAANDAEVAVVHVNTGDRVTDWDSRLRRVADSLQTGFCGRVVPRLLRGDPATELLAFANEWRADLIATGLRGASERSAIGMGCTAVRLVRCANCSVLAVPPSAVSMR